MLFFLSSSFYFSTIHDVTSFTSSLRDLTEPQCACAHPGVLGWLASCRLYITVSSRGQNAELDPAVPLPGHGMDPLSSRSERLVLTGPGSRRFEAGQSGGQWGFCRGRSSGLASGLANSPVAGEERHTEVPRKRARCQEFRLIIRICVCVDVKSASRPHCPLRSCRSALI